MITIILIILSMICLCLWALGAAVIAAFSGWDLNKVDDLIKTIFWPITIFFKK